MTLTDFRDHRQQQLRQRADRASIFVSAGIGDAIALTCFLELPADLRTIYYATRKQTTIEEYLRLVADEAVDHVSVCDDWSQRWAFYSLPEYLRSANAKRLEPCEDWSIAAQFPRIEKQAMRYRGLPAAVRQAVHSWALPERYAVCQPATDDKRDSRRDLTAEEIAAVSVASERLGLPLVLLHNGSGLPVKHPNVIDLRNQSTLLENVAMTLRASAYFGIDSVLSVVASKVLPPSRLLIKTVNDHCRRWQRIYFAPHTTFGFLVPSLI